MTIEAAYAKAHLEIMALNEIFYVIMVALTVTYMENRVQTQEKDQDRTDKTVGQIQEKVLEPTEKGTVLTLEKVPTASTPTPTHERAQTQMEEVMDQTIISYLTQVVSETGMLSGKDLVLAVLIHESHQTYTETILIDNLTELITLY